jgi:hypothetical protein
MSTSFHHIQIQNTDVESVLAMDVDDLPRPSDF